MGGSRSRARVQRRLRSEHHGVRKPSRCLIFRSPLKPQAARSRRPVGESSSSNQMHAASRPEVAITPPSRVDVVQGVQLPPKSDCQFPLVKNALFSVWNCSSSHNAKPCASAAGINSPPYAKSRCGHVVNASITVWRSIWTNRPSVARPKRFSILIAARRNRSKSKRAYGQRAFV